MRRNLGLFLAASLLSMAGTGCHAKFKKHASSLGSVRVQVLTTGGPDVELGHVSTSSDSPLLNLAAAAVNITQEVREVNQTVRIAQAVDIQAVNHALDQGIAQTLGSGPPFAWTNEDPAPATLQMEVMSYGLVVPYLGAPGEFYYDVRARIYTRDGERVYKHRMSCGAGAGSPDATAQVLGVVNNVKQLNSMTDEQIQESFLVVAEWCGTRWVAKMRKHAG